jgi:hypothetical protein
MSANCEEELQKEKRIQSIKELEASALYVAAEGGRGLTAELETSLAFSRL